MTALRNWFALGRINSRRFLASLSTAAPKLFNENIIEKLSNPSNKYRLRSYQIECVSQILKSFDNGESAVAVSMPTGSGKTVTFCSAVQFLYEIPGLQNRTLFLVHRQELAQQIYNTCKSIYPDKSIDMEMAEQHARPNADLVVASVQSLRRNRLEKFPPNNFSNIIIDEAHHSPTSSYLSILRYFGFSKRNPDVDIHEQSVSHNGTNEEIESGFARGTVKNGCLHGVQLKSPRILGFSATMFRTDMIGLDAVFDTIVYHIELSDLIAMNQLCEPRIISVHAIKDLSDVKQHKGDFVASSLSMAVNTEECNEVVVQSWSQLTDLGEKYRRTLVFGVDIAHARCLQDIFQQSGIDARSVTSKTSKKLRKTLIDEFRQGQFPVLINCGVFTEGTDIPEIDCVLLDRPTRSPGLLMQMIGRGLRTHSAKDHCLIVDMFGSSSGVDGLATVPTLVGLESKYIQAMKFDKTNEGEAARLVEDKDSVEEKTLMGDPTNSSIGSDDNHIYDLEVVEYRSLQNFLTNPLSGKISSVNNWLRLDPTTAVLFGPDNGYLKVMLQTNEKPSPKTTERFCKAGEEIKAFEQERNLTPIQDSKKFCVVRYYPNPVFDGYADNDGKKKNKNSLQYFKQVILTDIFSFASAIHGADTAAKMLYPVALIKKYASWRTGCLTNRQEGYIKLISQSLKANSGENGQEPFKVKQLNKGQAADAINLYKHRFYRAARSILRRGDSFRFPEPKKKKAPARFVRIQDMLGLTLKDDDSRNKHHRA